MHWIESESRKGVAAATVDQQVEHLDLADLPELLGEKREDVVTDLGLLIGSIRREVADDP
jgi:hypothetical protein